MRPELLRAWWFHRQGLDRRGQGLSAEQVFERFGWARSVGGVNPYLTLFSRARIGQAEAERALAETRIHELPSARGCTYVVPREHFALALKIGQGFSDSAAINMAVKHLGVTMDEIDRLEASILRALESGPMDPKQLKEAVEDASRSLGEEGKKRGQTTTLPLGLGRLQTAGKIRRVPVDGRLDTQRYRYALWDPSPLDGFELSQEEAFREVAKLYFRWIGPATLSSFKVFSGLGVNAAKQAIEGLGLVTVEEGSDLLMMPEDREELMSFKVPDGEQIALVGSIDGIVHLRGDSASLVDPEDHDEKMWGEKSIQTVGSFYDLENHGIFDRGRLIGLWEFDPERSEVVWKTFQPATEAIRKEIAVTETYLREQLGDARSFSLDSPASRKPKLEFLRSGGRLTPA